jgi:hypothetical protein
MLEVDESAVMRVAGLMRAFDADDAEQWGAVLASDQDEPKAPYFTFCAMAAYLDRALDWLTHETEHSRDDLLDMLQAAFVKLLAEIEEEGDSDG